MKHLVAVLFLGTLVACQSSGRYPPVGGDLDRGIVYSEQPRDGGDDIEHSKPDASDAATVIPAPGTIDINSRIHIAVNANTLKQGGLSSVDEVRLQALKDRQGRLQGLLNAIAEQLEHRTAALEAYAAWKEVLNVSSREPAAFQRFETLRNGMAAVGDKVDDAVKAMWPEDGTDFELFEEVDDAFSSIGASTAAQDLTQAEIDSVAAETQAILNAVSFRIRMEAFLQSAGKQPVPVHLPGYDNLPEGKLERRDRWGLALEGAELARFDELSRQSVELAEAGERVRKGEQDLEEAFRSLTNTVLGDVPVLAADGIRLSRELEPDVLGRRLRATEAAARSLTESISGRLEETAKARVEEIRDLARLAAKNQEQDLRNANDLTALLSEIAELKSLLDDPDPTQLPRLQVILTQLPARAKNLVNDGIQDATQKATGLATEVENLIDQTPEEIRGIVREEWGRSDLQADLADWEALGGELLAYMKRLEELTTIGSFVPIPADFKVPGAIDVPLDGAPDTFLDLELTSRLEGDRLRIRTTLLDGEETVGLPHEASFDIHRYGWHARLDPAVVLAKPDNLEGSDENFRFAPVLGWLHTYNPRPEDNGRWDDFWRGTDMSFGPHAAFLSFDTDKEIEIGLGLTLGFWDGVLQFGAGWNLNADSSDDGRLYYYVGSSLIPLLQAFHGQ